LAVLALITNSNLVGCSTGKSLGFAPFKMPRSRERQRVDFLSLLCKQARWPSNGCTAKKTNELAPSHAAIPQSSRQRRMRFKTCHHALKARGMIACPLWVKSGLLQRTTSCPLWAKSGHVFWPRRLSAERSHRCRNTLQNWRIDAPRLRRSVLQPVASFGVKAIGKTNSKRDQFLPSDDAVSWPR